MTQTLSKIFGLIICPILILIALFTLGNLVAQAFYSQYAVIYSDIDFIVVAAGIGACFYFYKSLRKLTIK